ncbi:hypothetical protein, partial [Mycolicibacterium sp.]|uniref:hypothetical protein n=1 Tax=Mycolicibacterium sp. TaxID=2320850 RepID=UPI0025DC6CB9
TADVIGTVYRRVCPDRHADIHPRRIQPRRIHHGHNRIRDQQPNYPFTCNDHATVADDSGGVNSRRWTPQRP